MSDRAEWAGRFTGPLASLIPAASVALVTLLFLWATPPPTPGPSASAPAWLGPNLWSNRVITVAVGTASPGLEVAATNATNPFGLIASVQGLTEYRGTGAGVARADLSGASWQVSNSSSPAGLAVSYSTQASELRPTSPTPVGRPTVYVNLTAFAGAGITGAGVTAVRIDLAIINWSWLRPTDSLALVLPLSPNDTAIEHLSEGPTGTMYGVPNDNGPAREFLSWSPDASARNISGGGVVVPTIGQVTGSPTNSTVSIVFGGANASYTEVDYTVHLGLVVSPPAAAVSPSAAWIAIGGGGVLLLVVGGAARHTVSSRATLRLPPRSSGSSPAGVPPDPPQGGGR